MKLLDTDVLIAALRGDPDARRTILTAGAEGTTTTLNAAELLEGAALAHRPEVERLAVERFLRQLRLVPFGPRAARAYGPLSAELWKKGTYPGLMDVLVASVASTEGATIVTRNRKHFAAIPDLPIEEW